MRPNSADSTFHAVADPTRRKLLSALRTGELSASELATPFSQTRSAVSQHLSILARAGLVTRRRDGRRQVYRLEPQPLKEVLDWTEEFSTFWDKKLEQLGKHLRDQE